MDRGDEREIGGDPSKFSHIHTGPWTGESRERLKERGRCEDVLSPVFVALGLKLEE